MQYIHTIYTMHWIMRATVVGSNSSVHESPSKNQDLESSVENRGKFYGPQPVYCWLFVVYHVGNMVTRLSRLGVRTAEPGYRSGINRVRQQVRARARPTKAHFIKRIYFLALVRINALTMLAKPSRSKGNSRFAWKFRFEISQNTSDK